MDTDMVLAIIAVLAVLLGLAGTVLPLLPGAPLLFGGLWLAASLDDYSRVGTTMLVALAVLALLSWLVDYMAAALSVRRAGASRQAATGAGVGSLLGLFAGLPGLILGPVAGAMAGEWQARRDGAQAVRAGLAAGAGFIVATLAKLALALLMVLAFGIAWFV